jgi:hypothetical protein
VIATLVMVDASGVPINAFITSARATEGPTTALAKYRCAGIRATLAIGAAPSYQGLAILIVEPDRSGCYRDLREVMLHVLKRYGLTLGGAHRNLLYRFDGIARRNRWGASVRSAPCPADQSQPLARQH